jgi:hypothetical protein
MEVVEPSGAETAGRGRRFKSLSANRFDIQSIRVDRVNLEAWALIRRKGDVLVRRPPRISVWYRRCAAPLLQRN